VLKVLLNCNDHPAVFDLPHDPLEIGDYLLAAGHWNPYADLRLADGDDPDQVQVKLIPETAADVYLGSLFPKDARLSTINTVCDLFYGLPAERQSELTNDIALGKINKDIELLDAIKAMKFAEANAPAIVFSRVKLWSDTGEECEFFTGGAPASYEDIENHEDCIDFKEFLEQLPGTDMEGITAYITTFTEGGGEPEPADKSDIERIYTAVAEVDIDTITGWNRIGESQFSFDYDVDELFGMNGIE